MPSKFPLGVGVLAIGLVVSGCGGGGNGAPAKSDDRVALRITGREVSLSEFERELNRRVVEEVEPSKRDSVVLAFANGYVDRLVMGYEATHHPRGDTTGIARQMSDRRRQVIRELYREEQLKDVDLSPEKMKQIFDWLGEEVSVRTVMVTTKEEAQKVHDEIKGGMPFEDAVKKYSVDQFSAQNGGQLGWLSYGQIAGIDDAAYALAVGEISEPVWSRRGWHVIKLEGRRPRQRDSVEQPDYFNDFYGNRLREQRWAEFLDTYWRKLKVEWNEPGYDLALTLQTDYRDRYLEKTREAFALRDQGKQLDESFTQFPRGPEPSPEQAAQLVADVGGMPYTVRDAADDLWLTPLDQRPDFTRPHAYRLWLQEKMTERALAHFAETSGFLADPDRRRRLNDALEYEWVERLYNREVFRKAQPTEVDLRAFYDKYAQYYQRPAELDIAVVVVPDVPSAHRAAELLKQGQSVSQVKAAVPGAEVTARTGFKTSFPSWAGLDERLRFGGRDSVGKVTEPIEASGKMVVSRIEDRREGGQSSFAEAKQLLVEHCAMAMREQRTRVFLDSLRTAFGGEVISDVVLAARLAPQPAPPAGGRTAS